MNKNISLICGQKAEKLLTYAYTTWLFITVISAAAAPKEVVTGHRDCKTKRFGHNTSRASY